MKSRKTYTYAKINDAIFDGNGKYAENLLNLGFDWEGDRIIVKKNVKYPSDPDEFAALLKCMFDLKLYTGATYFRPFDTIENDRNINVLEFVFRPDVFYFDNYQVSEKISKLSEKYKEIVVNQDHENPRFGIVVYLNNHGCYTVSIINHDIGDIISTSNNPWFIDLDDNDLLELLRYLSQIFDATKG